LCARRSRRGDFRRADFRDGGSSRPSSSIDVRGDHADRHAHDTGPPKTATDAYPVLKIAYDNLTPFLAKGTSAQRMRACESL